MGAYVNSRLATTGRPSLGPRAVHRVTLCSRPGRRRRAVRATHTHAHAGLAGFRPGASGRYDPTIAATGELMIRLGTPNTSTRTRLLLLGAGELGKEVAIEAQRLGIEVVAVDRYANAPAMQVAHRSHVITMT